MEPEFTTATDWAWIEASYGFLLWFCLLALVGALALLAAHAVLPSLIVNRQLGPQARLVQYGWYLAALVSLGVAFYFLAVALQYAWAVLGRLFPNWWI